MHDTFQQRHTYLYYAVLRVLDLHFHTYLEHPSRGGLDKLYSVNNIGGRAN